VRLGRGIIDTLGAVTLGVFGVDTLGAGSVLRSVVSTLGGAALCGAISSKVETNFLIACILSIPGCFNGMLVAVFCSA
jgi:hypothetical protein